MSTPLQTEPRTAGVREVMGMAGPIILGSMSFVVMDFADKYMVAQLGTEHLAAIGSASIWAYLLSTFILGIVGCIATFVSQSVGRGDPSSAGSYAWQGFYVSLGAAVLSLLLWPLSSPLFNAMGHSAESTAMELAYFNIRLLGYFPLAWATALGAFFQAVNRPAVPMYAMMLANFANIFFNYCFIYGHFGFPALGVAGAAWGTIIAQYFQAVFLHVYFYRPEFDTAYGTRHTWRLHPRRFWELMRIGTPGGVSMLLDIATWGIFISFVVGRFGDAALAANNAALSIMHISFVPAIALNQAIAPIVGKWLGAGDLPRARARTYTTLKICAAYMAIMGVIFAIFGAPIIGIFNQDPAIIQLGWSLLVLAAVFQLSDSVNIVLMGALRGAGDTRWVMWATLFGAYFCFLPLACVLAFVYPGGPLWAWVGAALYIMGLSVVMYLRFRSEKWKDIQIFMQAPESTLVALETPAPPVAPLTPVVLRQPD